MKSKILAMHRGKRVELTRDQAGELVIGGLVGVMSLVAQMKLPTRLRAELHRAFLATMPLVPLASLVAVYERMAKTRDMAFTATERRRMAELSRMAKRAKPRANR